MKSHVLRALGKIPNKKKNLKFHLEFIFNNFQEEKMGNFLVDQFLKHSHCWN